MTYTLIHTYTQPWRSTEGTGNAWSGAARQGIDWGEG